MPVPKQKSSRKRTGDRRKHIVITPLSLVVCSHCQAMMLPHRSCPECGYYRGRQVMTIEDKKARGKKEKREAKEASAKGKARKTQKEQQEGEEPSDKPLSIEKLSKK